MPKQLTRVVVGGLVAMLCVAGAAFGSSTVERNLELAPGGELVLKADQGSVPITGREGGGGQLVVRWSRGDFEDRFDLIVRESGGRVVVEIDRRRPSWGWNQGRLEIEIDVPVQTTVSARSAGGDVELHGTVGRAELHTSGGDVRVEGVEGSVDVDTSGGQIDVRDVIGDVAAHTSGGSIDGSRVSGRFDADTSGGSIVLERVAGDIRAETSGGRVRITDAGASVDAHSSGGGVSVGFGPGNDRGGRVSSSGGGVEIRLDPTVGLAIDASSSGGSVRSEFRMDLRGRVSRTSLRGDLNGGGETLRVRSSGGGVTIRPR